jgi:hypothetical protein
MTKEWTNEIKIKSRKSNIIDYYRSYFGEKVPENKQYWTLCGKCVENGDLQENTEPDQMIKSGLITENQFFGVELDPHIFNILKTCKICNFLNGDIYKVILNSHNKQQFNPAIINCDFLATHITQQPILMKILYLLSCHEKYYDVLVSANFSREVNKFKISEEQFEEEFKAYNDTISFNDLYNRFLSSGREFKYVFRPNNPDNPTNISSSYKNGPTTMTTVNFIIRKL